MLCQRAITLGAVEIVSIDHSKRFVNSVRGHENRVCCAPGLAPATRHGKPRRKKVEFLKDVIDGDAIFKPRTDGLLECLLNILANDEDDPAESSTMGVVD